MPDKDDMDFRAHARNIQYTTKVAKLLNQTETGIARALADESENFLERQYGRIFVAVDLGFTSDTYDIGEVIIETLQREYFADLNRTAGASFEHALTVINQTLADLAVEGENDWVGKLNAVIGVLHENEIHLTKVGFAEAYLVRGHTITNITESLTTAEGTAATAKTFLNVASGELEVGDKVLLSNGELFNYAKVSDVRRHLYLHPPAKAIRKLADQVLAQGMPERLATVVLELTTIDLISSEPVSDDPDEIVLGAPRRHFETLQRFKPLRPDTPIAKILDTSKKHWERRVRPTVQRTVQTGVHRAKVIQAKRKGVAPPPPPPRPAAGTPTAERRPDGQRQQAVSQVAAVTGRAVRALLKLWQPVGELLGRGWDKSGIGRTGAWRAVSRKVGPGVAKLRAVPLRQHLAGSRKIVYRNLIILFGLVLVISMALSINATQNRKADARIKKQIEEIEALQAKAESSYIYKDFPAARTQLGEAKTKADALAREKRQKEKIASVREGVDKSYERINNVVRVPDTPVTDFKPSTNTTAPRHLAQTGGTLVAIPDSGMMASYNQTTKETKTAVANTGLTGQVKGLASTSNGDILLYTDKPAVYQYDSGAGTLGEVSVATGSTWEPGLTIDTVQQNLFILDAEHNQIWRHNRTLSSFNKGEAYFSTPPDLKGVTDMITGAQVYLLKGDGSVSQYAGGNAQDFKVQGLPAPDDRIEGANALTSNSATGGLYVADPKRRRIIEYNGKGEYARQFVGDSFGGLTDMVVDDKTATLFVLADGRLFAINLGS